MTTDAPFLVDDLDGLRDGLRAAEEAGSRRGELWSAVRRCARASPEGFPWFTPFVALVTGERRDIDAAAGVLRSYLSRLDPLGFSSGLQYHFWCFAFPHAKWCLYFQWLRFLGAFGDAEARRIAERLLSFAFVNFLYGMRTKPEPECVDNQALSLCFSNSLIGELFSRGDPSPGMAAVLREEGLRRLPGILGGIPRSGYTGEGSDYMDCVIGPAIPLVVELLERATGETGLHAREFPPSGVTPAQVLRMVAREWMPGGLLLPWDNYGYTMGVRSPLAWAAARTGEPAFLRILEREAVWSWDIGVGWAYDDLPWTLAWWPPAAEASAATSHAPERRQEDAPDWFEPEVGGALATADRRSCLVQMWDPSEPVVPTRSHVNPNAVVLAACGVPLSADGTPAPSCRAFDHEDTWRTVRHRIGEDQRYNFGSGCAGAHSVLIVDGWEGMRAFASYPQLRASGSGPGAGLWADVTPLYAERWPDAVAIRRRSALHADRFFTVEDLAVFGGRHEVRARFLLRPEVAAADRGIMVRTAEGVGLRVIAVLGPAAVSTRRVEGFPDRLEAASRIVDFAAEGRECRWLFALLPSCSRRAEELSEGWRCIPDEGAALSEREAARLLEARGIALAPRLPAYMLADAPVARRWWYRRSIAVERSGPAWLRLPRGMADGALWIDGVPVDLAPYAPLSKLVQPEVPLPDRRGAEIDVVLRTDVPVSHYEGGGWGTTGINGAPALCTPSEEERVLEAGWERDVLSVRTTTAEYRVGYRLLEAP